MLNSGDVTVSNKIWALIPEDPYLGMETNNKIYKKKDHNCTLLHGERTRREKRELWRGKSLVLLMGRW